MLSYAFSGHIKELQMTLVKFCHRFQISFYITAYRRNFTVIFNKVEKIHIYFSQHDT